jgi:RNA polymerase sigma-70 factor, ECF subfamily
MMVDLGGEALLVDRAVEGDRDAFARLYDLHLDPVYRYVRYRVGNKPDAEDVTQQVFLNAWRSIRSYRRSGTPFRHWLIRIAHNQSADLLRRRVPTTELRHDPTEPDERASVEEGAIQRISAEAIRLEIRSLPEDQQQAVTLRLIADMNYADIGVALGKSEGNARVMVHRALLRLRSRLHREVSR